MILGSVIYGERVGMTVSEIDVNIGPGFKFLWWSFERIWYCFLKRDFRLVDIWRVIVNNRIYISVYFELLINLRL